MTRLYLLLAVLGTIAPFAFFGNFIVDEGVNLPEFVRQLFATSPAGGFTADLLITSAAFWVWSFQETRQHRMRNWWGYVVLNLIVVLSCALPLFLFFRCLRIDHVDVPVSFESNA